MMSQIGSSRSEQDFNTLMRQHEAEGKVLDSQWRGELRQQQLSQANSFWQWMREAYEEMKSPGGGREGGRE